MMNKLSNDTLEKYNKGYRKASTVLKAYLPKSPTMSEILSKKEKQMQPETATETEPTEKAVNPENLQFYTFRECNLLVSHKVATRANKAPKGCIQTGQSNRPNGLPYARIYTNPKNGKIYVVNA